MGHTQLQTCRLLMTLDDLFHVCSTSKGKQPWAHVRWFQGQTCKTGSWCNQVQSRYMPTLPQWISHPWSKRPYPFKGLKIRYARGSTTLQGAPHFTRMSTLFSCVSFHFCPWINCFFVLFAPQCACVSVSLCALTQILFDTLNNSLDFWKAFSISLLGTKNSNS